MDKKHKGKKKSLSDPTRKPKGSKHKNNVMREELKKLKELRSQIGELVTEDLKSFAMLPLSTRTLKGLKNSGFTVPTKVQRQSLIYSLAGSDVVAAAKTGSGKTLAFLIPILEKLYSSIWTHLDGLGALIITPTRELAYQIFDVLNRIGKGHEFSAGLLIGGTDMTFEWKRVATCNIAICTPGRLLHHMTENPEFACDNIQIVVFDEADMCLSLGFADSMNCILEELPLERQTLLFSATQTRDVNDLIRAGCRNPVFCSVHEHSKTITPKSLVEEYLVCEPHDKFSFLWSFVTHHKKQKILVFLSTCKQVKYITEMFCKLQPGLSVMGIHGNMKQLKRMAIYNQFCNKQIGVLFATDVAARGLDIPAVHWVIQADCPEDVTTYIHRAGRTARYSKEGNALLVLTPSEEPVMVASLNAKNIQIQQIFVDPDKERSVNIKIDIILTRNRYLKEDAVRAFKSYMKHIAQMKNKKVFNILSVDLDAYARSLGLIVTPRVRFLEKLLKQKYGASKLTTVKDEDISHFGRSRPSTMDFGADESSDEEEDGFLVSSKNQPELVAEAIDPDQPKPMSKKKMRNRVSKEEAASKLQRKGIIVNKINVFDDDGNLVVDRDKVQMCDSANQVETPTPGINIPELKKIIREEDALDKQVYREIVKDRKHDKKRKEKERKRQATQRGKGGDEEEEEEEAEGEYEDSEPDEGTQDIIDSLPDPDKIYNKGDNEPEEDDGEEGNDSEGEEGNDSESEGSDESDNEQAASDSSSDDDEDSKEAAPRIRGKRKARLQYREAKRAKMAQSNTLSELPMDEQEQLALYLLSGKR